MSTPHVALIVGAGSGLSAALARRLAREGLSVALAARGPDKLAALTRETGAKAFQCDAGDARSVSALFKAVHEAFGANPDLVVYNASARYRTPIETLEPAQLGEALRVLALGGAYVAQAAAAAMIPKGRGTLIFSGATASVKGLPGSTPFAMGKFALRGLAQCLARELAPKGIHVAHFVIDGRIAKKGGDAPPSADAWLDPDAIAEAYVQAYRQHRSAWTWEVELRPWVEKF